MKPKCYNRADYGNYLVQDGWEPGVTPDGTPTRYPVMVEVPFAMSQGCKSWAADKASDPVPLMEGWECDGCRHFPAADVRIAIRNARMRAKA